MPKERIRNSQAPKGKQAKRESRPDSGGQVRGKRGDTRIDTLRQTYGESFAPGIRGDAHLKTLLDRTGSSSLSEYLKNGKRLPAHAKANEIVVNGNGPGIRYASDERFARAHRKTGKLHAGLFRRLAE